MKKILILYLILISCTQIDKKSVDKEINKKKQDIIVVNKSQNKYSLSDSINYRDFNMSLNSNGDVYSSFDSLYRKSYSNFQYRIVKFGLTKAEKKAIYKIVREIDFFSLPDTLIEKGADCILPAFSTEITIMIGKNIHQVYYSGYCSVSDQAIAERYKRIEEIVYKIINGKEEVNSLPISDVIYL